MYMYNTSWFDREQCLEETFDCCPVVATIVFIASTLKTSAVHYGIRVEYHRSLVALTPLESGCIHTNSTLETTNYTNWAIQNNFEAPN